MTGFEPGFSGIGSNRSANCATTTAQIISLSPWWLQSSWALASANSMLVSNIQSYGNNQAKGK